MGIPFLVDALSLTMFRVYMYHDVARLFSAKDEADNIWMVLWADEHHHDAHAGYEGQDDWLAVKVSEERFTKIESGEIDLHDAFSQAESGTGFYIECPWPGGHDTANVVNLVDLENGLFHEPGIRLSLKKTD